MSTENVSSTPGNNYLNSFISGVLGSISFCCEQALRQQKQPETAASQLLLQTLLLKTASYNTGWGEKCLWWDHQREKEQKKSYKLKAILMFSPWQLQIAYLKTYIACASIYGSYIFYVYGLACRQAIQDIPAVPPSLEQWGHLQPLWVHLLQESCGNPDGLQVKDHLCFWDQAPQAKKKHVKIKGERKEGFCRIKLKC